MCRERIQAEGIEDEVREVVLNESSQFFDLDESAQILHLLFPLSPLADWLSAEGTF